MANKGWKSRKEPCFSFIPWEYCPIILVTIVDPFTFSRRRILNTILYVPWQVRDEHLELLACPDCRGHLDSIKHNGQMLGLHCKICELVYPVEDNIPILLAREVRNPQLEYPLIERIEKLASDEMPPNLAFSVSNTMSILKSRVGMLTWEWADEAYWSETYSVEQRSGVAKNWNDRIWQRESLIEALFNITNLKGKTIISVGCGEGQNFKDLLSRYCDSNSLYIGIDISLQGLKLNRSRNLHTNSLYVLSSADYELPFSSGIADILCYFGVLHHTRNKCRNIAKDLKILKHGGHIILTEPILRPSIPLPSRLLETAERSLHEGHIHKTDLLKLLVEEIGVDIIWMKEEQTPFLTAAITFFRSLVLSSKSIFQFILRIDRCIAMRVGRSIPHLGGGTILLLAEWDGKY